MLKFAFVDFLNLTARLTQCRSFPSLMPMPIIWNEARHSAIQFASVPPLQGGGKKVWGPSYLGLHPRLSHDGLSALMMELGRSEHRGVEIP